MQYPHQSGKKILLIVIALAIPCMIANIAAVHTVFTVAAHELTVSASAPVAPFFAAVEQSDSEKLATTVHPELRSDEIMTKLTNHLRNIDAFGARGRCVSVNAYSSGGSRHTTCEAQYPEGKLTLGIKKMGDHPPQVIDIELQRQSPQDPGHLAAR